MSILNTKILSVSSKLNLPSYTGEQIEALLPQKPGAILYSSTEAALTTYDGENWIGIVGPELFAFSAATFTSGGAIYRSGPSLSQARTGLTGTGVDTWKSNTQYFNVSDGIQSWTVPKDGTYSIDAYGAEGATGGSGATGPGGLGARIKGNFALTKGEVVNLVVGQVGWTQTNGWGGATGSGGSFAWRSTSTTQPLIAAGGGGGGGIGDASSSAGQASATGGTGGNNGQAGGSNANPGSGGCNGGGGNGWNGGPSNQCGGAFTWTAIYLDPRGLTTGGHDSNGGGFGGGAGSHGGSGGGGGYSGGGGGGWAYAGRGGGGGSYNSGTNQTNTAATRTGSGQIIITFIS